MEMLPRIYSRLALFSKNGKNKDFRKHIKNNGTGILLENNQITIYDKGLEMAVMSLDEIGILQEIQEDFATDAILASIITLYLSDISIEEIRESVIKFAI